MSSKRLRNVSSNYIEINTKQSGPGHYLRVKTTSLVSMLVTQGICFFSCIT